MLDRLPSRTTVGGANSNALGEVIVFDIFPTTLEAFYKMEWDTAHGIIVLPSSTTTAMGS